MLWPLKYQRTVGYPSTSWASCRLCYYFHYVEILLINTRMDGWMDGWMEMNTNILLSSDVATENACRISCPVIVHGDGQILLLAICAATA